MSKNHIKAVVATVLALTALILYGLLHDISQLALFQHPQLSESTFGKALVPFCSRLHHAFMVSFIRIPFWRLLNNYLVDALWFISFTLYMQSLLDRPVNYVLCIVMAVTSECSQLIFSRLGTFDLYDLLLYGAILAAVYVCDKRPVAVSKA